MQRLFLDVKYEFLLRDKKRYKRLEQPYINFLVLKCKNARKTELVNVV